MARNRNPYRRYRQWAIKVLAKEPWHPLAYRCPGCGPGYIANEFIAGDVIPRARCQGCGCAIELWNLWTRCYHVHPDPETGKRKRCNTVNHVHLPLLPLVYHFGLTGV
jgi:hypothetical protein